MKNFLLLSLTLMTIVSCGERSKLYDLDGKYTAGNMGLEGTRVAEETNAVPFVCDRHSKDGCISQIVLMGKMNGRNLQTCPAFFVGDETIAAHKKCLPRRGKDQTFPDWLEQSCKQIAFKDLTGFVYRCSDIEEDKFSDIIYVKTNKKSKVGFLETTDQGINLEGNNKIYEITSFKRGNIINFAVSEGKYTRAKKKCTGLKNSMANILGSEVGAKKQTLTNCNVDWNSTGSPVIVDGKVAAMISAPIKGKTDFGGIIDARDGMAIAENFACQSKFYKGSLNCMKHHSGHKRDALKSIISKALEASEVNLENKKIEIFRKDNVVAPMIISSTPSCYNDGYTAKEELCPVTFKSDKRTGVIDMESITATCDYLVNTNSKVYMTPKGLLRKYYQFDSIKYLGFHQDGNLEIVNECI